MYNHVYNTRVFNRSAIVEVSASAISTSLINTASFSIVITHLNIANISQNLASVLYNIIQANVGNISSSMATTVVLGRLIPANSIVNGFITINVFNNINSAYGSTLLNFVAIVVFNNLYVANTGVLQGRITFNINNEVISALVWTFGTRDTTSWGLVQSPQNIWNATTDLPESWNNTAVSI